MSTAVGPGPGEGVLVQHPGHHAPRLVLAHVGLTLGVLVVWNVESATEHVFGTQDS